MCAFVREWAGVGVFVCLSVSACTFILTVR